MKPANGKPQRFKVIYLSKMVGGCLPQETAITRRTRKEEIVDKATAPGRIIHLCPER